MLTPTRFRFGSFNIQTPLAGRWLQRRAGTVRVLRAARCSVIACQELDYASAAYIAAGLGDHWLYQRHNQNGVFWDSRKWDWDGVERAWNLDDGPDPKIRGLILVRLKSVKTGQVIDAGCSHLSSNSTRGDTALREREAVELARILKRYPASIVGVDLNDKGGRTRAALKAAGIVSLRESLTGYATGIDDVLTGPAIAPYAAKTVRNPYSDHGHGIRVSSVTPRPTNQT